MAAQGRGAADLSSCRSRACPRHLVHDQTARHVRRRLCGCGPRPGQLRLPGRTAHPGQLAGLTGAALRVGGLPRPAPRPHPAAVVVLGRRRDPRRGLRGRLLAVPGRGRHHPAWHRDHRHRDAAAVGPREGTAGAARGVGPIRLRTGTRRRHLRRADRRSSGSQRPALRSVDCDRDDGRVVPGRLRGLDEGRGRLDDALRPHHHGSAPRRLPGQPRRARDRDLSRAARQPVLRPQAPDRREDGVGDPRRGGPCRQVLVRSTGAGLFCPARRGDQRGLRQRGPGLRATPPVVAAVGAASSAGDSHPRLGHHDLLGDHRAGAARPGDTPRGQPGSHPGRRGGARGRSARRRSRSDLTTGAVPRPDLAPQRPRRRLRAVARRARGHRPPGRSPGLVADALAAVTPSRPRAGPGCRFRDENPADVADQRGGL